MHTGATNVSFGAGSGRVLLNGVQCSGTESELAECSNMGITIRDCTQSQDAGVICQGIL